MTDKPTPKEIDDLVQSAQAFVLEPTSLQKKLHLEAQAWGPLADTPQPAPARADGFFLLLPQRPKPEAPAGTAGLDWDAYSGAQMLAFGRDCSDAAIAALRTQQPAPAQPDQPIACSYGDNGYAC